MPDEVNNVIDLALYRARRRWAEQDQALERYCHTPACRWDREGHHRGRCPTMDEQERSVERGPPQRG